MNAQRMTDQERAALLRLLTIAQADTGTSRRVSDFLLAWWNARECGGFDLVDLWSLDAEILDDVLTIVRFVAHNRHYPDDLGFGPQFVQLVDAWRPKLRRGRS